MMDAENCRLIFQFGVMMFVLWHDDVCPLSLAASAVQFCYLLAFFKTGKKKNNVGNVFYAE